MWPGVDLVYHGSVRGLKHILSVIPVINARLPIDLPLCMWSRLKLPNLFVPGSGALDRMRGTGYKMYRGLRPVRAIQ